MVKKLLFIPLLFLPLLLVAQTAEYQKKFEEIEAMETQGKLKSMLPLVESVFEETKNNADLQDFFVRALLYKGKIALITKDDVDDKVAVVNQFKQLANNQDNIQTKAILESMIAQVLWDYYNNNSYKINQRTNTEESLSDDFRTWSSLVFLTEIATHYKASVKNLQQLSVVNIKHWEHLLLQQEQSQKKYQELRPTLMDLLAHRALDFFLNPTSNLYYFDQNDINQVQEAHVQISEGIIQELINYHQNNQNPSALLAAQHLKINNTPDLDNQIAALEKTSKAYTSNWYNGYSYYLLANAYQRKAQLQEENQDKKYWLDKALASAQIAIKSYPKTIGAENAANIKNTILQKEINIQVQAYAAANQYNPIRVSHKNLNQLHVRVLRTNRSIKQKKGQYKLLSGSTQKELNQLLNRYPTVQKFSINLKEFFDYQSHSTLIKLDPLPTGEYLVLVSDDIDFKVDSANALKHQFINISNHAIINRNNKNNHQLLVYNRESGLPTPNKEVQVFFSIHKIGTKLIGNYTTNSNGIAEFNYQPKQYGTYDYKIKGEEVDYSEYAYNRGYDDSDNKTIHSQIFTDRSIYRPGQTVYFKVISYEFNPKNNQYTAIPNHKESLELMNPNGESISNLSLQTNQYGSAHGNFVLPTSGITGSFDLNASHGRKSIQVEEYKRPKFSVDFDSIKTTFKLDQKIKIRGLAKAYSGNNITQAKVVYRVYRQAVYPYLPWWARNRGKTEPEEEITQGETATNGNGEFDIEFIAKPAQEKTNPKDIRTYHYKIIADVVDTNGETRTGETLVTVGDRSMTLNFNVPNQIDIADFKTISVQTNNLNGQFVPTTGQYTLTKLKAPERILRPNKFQDTDYQVYSENEFIQYFPHDDFNHQNQIHKRAKEKVLQKGYFNTKNTKEIKLKFNNNLPLGYYLLEGTMLADGDTITTQQSIFVYDKNNTQAIDNQLFTTSTPNKEYQPNDVAELFFASSAPSSNVWVEVEANGKILQTQNIQLNTNSKSINIPITEDMRGNAFVRYYFGKYNHAQQGQITLNVPYKNKDLQISLGTVRDKLQPGAKEVWELTVKGANQQQYAAELLATMYDASLDQFTPHNINFSVFNNYKKYPQHSNWDTNRNFWTPYFSDLPYHYKHNYYHNQTPNFSQINWFGFDINYSSSSQQRYVYKLSQTNKAAKPNGVPPPPDAVAEAAELLDSSNLERKERVRSPADSEPITGNAIDANNPPIYIIDGEVATQQQFQQLKKQDIVTMSIVKGKEAISLYGEQATNGAIVVTTKLGASQQESLLGVKARKNLQETAFFYPQLQTDKQGNIKIQFTAPEALTQWKFMAFAHTPDLKTGNLEKLVRTQKELMVIPNAPRFLREGDQISFKTKIANLSNELINGKAQLLLFDAFSMQPIDADFGNAANQQSFSIEKNQSQSISWRLTIPQQYQAIVYRVVAKSKHFSDAEEAALPILTNRMLVTETLPLHIKEGQHKTFALEKLIQNQSKTLKSNNLTLELTSNPVWYAIMSLPYLREYPYECSEQIFSRFYGNIISQHLVNSNPKIKQVFDDWNQNNQLQSPLENNQELKNLLLQETPWVQQAKSESEQQKRLAVLFDINNMRNELTTTYQKLSKRQYSSGGFPWFDGGKENLYITTHIVAGLGHLKQMQIPYQEFTKESDFLTEKAVKFIDSKMHQLYLEDKKKNGKKLSNHTIIHYLYARSFFNDEFKIKHQTMQADFLKRIQTNVYDNPLQTKAMLALVLQRNNNKELANNIINSTKEFAVQSDEMGMYWKENKAGWYWYNNPIETQAMLIEAYDEILNDTESVEQMKVWLLKNKQTNRWQTTKATTEAVYALLNTGKDWVSAEHGITLSLGEQAIDLDTAKKQSGSGYLKKQWSAKEIQPQMGQVKISKTTPGIAWGALYWQYFEDLDKITLANTKVNLKKELFLQKNTDNGPVLTRITPQTPIQIGDLVKVRLEIKTDRNMEFIHIKDMRASGFEPTNVLSNYKWQDGLGYYESTKDAATNFFIDHMPKGIYVFEYDLRANNAGNFSNGITSLQNMYAPEFSAHSQGIRVNINQ